MSQSDTQFEIIQVMVSDQMDRESAIVVVNGEVILLLHDKSLETTWDESIGSRSIQQLEDLSEDFLLGTYNPE